MSTRMSHNMLMERDFPIPTYDQTLDAEVPSYSSSVLAGEQSLICIPRTGERRDPLAGKFERTSGNVTIVLSGQPACASQPTYGLNTIICGNLNFRKPDEVAEVVIKLTGKMEMVTSRAGARQDVLFSETFPLWSIRDACPSGKSAVPECLPFSLPLPNEYRSGGTLVSLPPSLEFAGLTPPSLFAKVRYEISVLIASKQKLGGLISKNKKFVIPFTYAPRMRPFRPIIDNPNFLETVKTAPDEWTEIPSELQLKDNSTPVHVNFFIPTSKIYALSEAIPFHIQLSGSVATLSEFLPPSYGTPGLAAPPKKTKRTLFASITEPTLRVSLLRQVVANIREGEAVFKNVRIGEGKLQPLPQVRDECSEGLCEIALDWTGSIKVDSEVLHGGFKTGELTIKDFIVLTVTPSCKSQFKEFRLPVPIRLVTDPWVDTTSRYDHNTLMRERTF